MTELGAKVSTPVGRDDKGYCGSTRIHRIRAATLFETVGGDTDAEPFDASPLRHSRLTIDDVVAMMLGSEDIGGPYRLECDGPDEVGPLEHHRPAFSGGPFGPQIEVVEQRPSARVGPGSADQVRRDAENRLLRRIHPYLREVGSGSTSPATFVISESGPPPGMSSAVIHSVVGVVRSCPPGLHHYPGLNCRFTIADQQVLPVPCPRTRFSDYSRCCDVAWWRRRLTRLLAVSA